MSEPQIFKNTVWEVGPKYPTARVTDHQGTLLTQAAVGASIPFKVFDLSAADPDNPIFSTNRLNTTVMFDALQDWDVDGVGYNFQDTVKTNEVTLEGGHTYRLSYLLSTTPGQRPVAFEWRARDLLSE